MDDQYLRPAELAKRLGMTEQTLYRMRQRGEGPKFHKINRRTVLYSVSELNAWMATNVQSSTKE